MAIALAIVLRHDAEQPMHGADLGGNVLDDRFAKRQLRNLTSNGFAQARRRLASGRGQRNAQRW